MTDTAPENSGSPGPGGPVSRTSGDISLRGFLSEVAAPTPNWSAGGVAAVTAAAAAGLLAMTARLATDLGDAGERAAEADALAARAMELAEEDAEAYRAVLDAQRVRDGGETRGGRLSVALAGAARPPQELAGLGERIAGMAESLAVRGKPVTRGDAIAAALLAAGAAGSAAVLARINLTTAGRPDDEGIGAADAAAKAADDAAKRLATP
ncbi:cyclodeaminase/cyclohydrolase family protein [Amycolatopsis palatopharyngis]|uniref:cyclodeaminase/cyclohydrolase family protein n=1 Tax=Amycolatopsis palatopharyngis TaxID=187982 RepID=UPI0013BE9B71|nr:cyclodeaminase/cyclohydrolase family protein [Amycolatopsis palatopharyngis]